MRRFLRRLRLPPGTRYALLTTEMAPGPGSAAGDAIHVTGTKGPLEDGWTTRVKQFVEQVLDRGSVEDGRG